nr:MAG TPA: hypothetical protein [Caudoviricetes sp.]
MSRSGVSSGFSILDTNRIIPFFEQILFNSCSNSV